MSIGERTQAAIDNFDVGKAERDEQREARAMRGREGERTGQRTRLGGGGSGPCPRIELSRRAT
eukprot:12525618-Alexandrium_andersonii.AAC.1